LSPLLSCSEVVESAGNATRIATPPRDDANATIPLATLGENAAKPEDPTLEVSYVGEADRLTVRANSAPLAVVLERIAELAEVDLVIIVPEALERAVTVDIDAQTLESGLKVLLAGFNKIFVRSGVLLATGDRQITRVLVASEYGARDEEFAAESGADFRGSELERATAALVPSLDSKNLNTYMGTVRAINELDPARAAAELIERLENTEEARDDEEAQQQRIARMRAAHALGVLMGLGNFDGVEALAFAAQSPDPDVARAANNSLAQPDSSGSPGPVVSVVTQPYLRLSRSCEDCILVRTPLGTVGSGLGNGES